MLWKEVAVVYFELICRNFPEETEEGHEHFQRDSRSPCQDLNLIHL
jgi:hypothetical protein